MKIKITETHLICAILFTISWSIHAADDELVSVQSSLKQVVLTGFTRERSNINLVSEIAGKVVKVNADIGGAVPASGVFACIDDTYVNLELKAVDADIASHKVDMDFYKKQVDRHRQLVDKKNVPQSLLDEFERQFEASKLAIKSEVIKKQRLEENKKRHCIKAPIGWKVFDRKIEPGQWVSSGELVGEVGDFSRLLIPFALTHHELLALKSNENNLMVTLTDYDLKSRAKIERISPAFDEQTRKILVDLVIEEELPDYRGGMRVDLVLGLPEENHVYLIPKKALDQRFGQVWLHRKDGTKIRAEILGNQGENWVKVSSPDLRIGEQLKVVQP